jgi:cytochrome c5
MCKHLVFRRWLSRGIVLAAALVLSACGLNTSGEPETVREVEVVSVPTTPPTQTPAADATLAPTTEGEAATPAASGLDLAAADYDRGMQVYLDQCAVCHGASEGVGPSLGGMAERAAARIAGVSAEDYLYQSVIAPGDYLVEGYDNIMPATYATDLSAQQINDVVKFMLEFSPERMMGSGAAGSEPTPAPAAAAISQEEVLTVSGQLVQGTTSGEAIPAGLEMELYVLDVHGELAGQYSTVSLEDGSYRFSNVARAAGNVYLVQVTYDGIPQGGQIAAIQGSEPEITKDLTVYQRTTDAATIAIRSAEMLVNYAPINEFGLEVWLSLELANTGDKIVTTDQPARANNWFVSVIMELPVGAFGIQPMQSETSQRYEVEVVDGVPIVRDTWPLRPGQVHAITVAYYLPYENSAVIDQAFNYPVVDATVLLPNDTVTFSGDQFDVEGEWCCRVSHGGVRVTELASDEEINPDKDFTLVKAHPLLKPLPADERMIFELVGRPTRTLNVLATTPQSSGSDDDNTLPVVLGVVGGTMIVLAGVLWWRQRGAVPPELAKAKRGAGDWRMPGPSADKNELIQAIASLDDAYAQGKMDEDTYHARRETLMERLIPLMDQEIR